MNRKNILISVGIALVLAGAFLYWRTSRVMPHKRVLLKKHIAAAQSARKKEGLPPIPSSMPKKFTNPKIAIVIDDFGYNKNNLETLFDIHQPVTLSILPDLRYSTEIAILARAHGDEVILHLPLEPQNKDVKEEYDTIKSGMKEGEITARLRKEVTSVPGLQGVSNHMGSKSTEDRALMTIIFKYLKSQGLYFSDSLTSQKSVCRDVAREVGIPYGRRDIFLDNSEDPRDIEKQVSMLRRMAFRKGKVIAVCHDKKNTMTVLARMMPEMAQEGVKFVYLSELVSPERSQRVR